MEGQQNNAKDSQPIKDGAQVYSPAEERLLARHRLVVRRDSDGMPTVYHSGSDVPATQLAITRALEESNIDTESGRAGHGPATTEDHLRGTAKSAEDILRAHGVRVEKVTTRHHATGVFGEMPPEGLGWDPTPTPAPKPPAPARSVYMPPEGTISPAAAGGPAHLDMGEDYVQPTFTRPLITQGRQSYTPSPGRIPASRPVTPPDRGPLLSGEQAPSPASSEDS